MRKQDEKRILVAEISWLRRILSVSRWKHITNEDSRKRTGMEVTTLDRTKARRFQWFGHVSRMHSTRLPYLALHTKVDRQQNRGRPRARWRDGVLEDIKDGGLVFSATQALVKEKEGSALLL
jgi:hypothetical protein